MRKHILLVPCLILSLCSTAQAQGLAFPPERFRAHVEFLADDLLEGRDTGTRGHEIAARYVASQFDAAGLDPGGDNGSWYQRVTLQQTQRGANRGSVTIAGPAGEVRFEHANNALVRMNGREPAQDISAALVFVGYGVEDPLLGLNDYRGLDVKGKIVVALRGFPKGMPSEEGAHVAAMKSEVAEKHGAVGFVTVATLQSEKAAPWARMLRYADDPDYGWVGADGRVHQDAPGIRVGASVHGPAADALFAGSARTLAAIRAEADRANGRPRGFALKTRIRIEGASTSQRVSSPNVVGILRGTDASLAPEHVVLLAHLDHLGVGTPKPDEPNDKDRIHNGALDNAAGIATMLEVARAAANARTRPRRSLLFLATTAEEKGLIGADYFVRHPTVPIRRIVGAVGLDMPLLLYPFTDVVAFGANHSSFGKLVAGAVAPMQLQLAPDPMPEQGVFTRSDHYPFVKQGVPAVFLVTGFANGGEKVWQEFLGGAYHSPDDDLLQKIDWQAGSRFAEANYRIMRAIADAETPPLWVEGDFFGDTFAPKGARAKK
jgi:Zn-dependent M28 family amino/carboxypeptidase